MFIIEPFANLSTFDKSATIALYLTFALIICLAFVAFLVKKKKPEMQKSLNSTFVGIIVGYSIGLIGLLLFLKLDEYIASGDISKSTFIPVLILLITAIVLAVFALIISIFKPEKFKIFSKISLSAMTIFLTVIIVKSLFSNYDGAEINVSSEVQLYLYAAFLVGIIAVLTLTCGKKSTANNTKAIVYASVCIAMSFALSYLRLFELPQGGSITFASLLPLMVFSYMFGIKKGVIAGVIYGFLQFIQAPWFMHPIQFLLDYPIAFSAIGLAGIFKEKNIFQNKKILQFALGAILAVTIRYFAHVVSGIFVFGSGEPENYGAVAWSFLYNAFAYADLAIVLIAGCGMFASKSFLRTIDDERIK